MPLGGIWAEAWKKPVTLNKKINMLRTRLSKLKIRGKYLSKMKLRPMPGGCRKFWNGTCQIKIYIYSGPWCQELSIGKYIHTPRRGGGGVVRGGPESFGTPSKNSSLLRNLNYIIGILSSNPVDWHPFKAIWVKGGSVDMSKSQRHTRSGAGCGVSQANGAAIHPKLTGLCQHEVVSGILKKRKQCGTVQASYGCLVGHVFMGAHI